MAEFFQSFDGINRPDFIGPIENLFARLIREGMRPRPPRHEPALVHPDTFRRFIEQGLIDEDGYLIG